MPRTEAQLAVSRANALKSTGPRTTEGKEAARRNALKHGLTGAGVVVPGEDEDEVARRAEGLAAELAPGGGMMASILVRRLAALSVRAERSVRHESAVTADRVRGAAKAFDEARQTEADRLLATLDQAPATHHRRLLALPEGIDRLVAALGDLRAAVAAETETRTEADPAAVAGNAGLADRFALLTGREPGVAPGPPTHADLIAAVVAEVARLEEHRATLDLGAVALSRAEAGERALVDAGPEATRLRRYEAATERSMVRIVRDLETARTAPPSQPATPADRAAAYARFLEAEGARATLGSFFPGGELSFPTPPSTPRPPRGPGSFSLEPTPLGPIPSRSTA